MEIYLIKKYNSIDNGYNLTIGGKGSLGYQHTEEFKIKASNRMKGNQFGLGIIKTQEQKEEISKNLTGRPVSDETKKKMKEKKEKSIIQYSKSGEFIAEFKSAKEAAEILNLNRRAISSCCVGTTKSSGGFI